MVIQSLQKYANANPGLTHSKKKQKITYARNIDEQTIINLAEGNVIGFYSKTDLLNQEEFESTLADMEKVYNRVNIKGQRLLEEKLGKPTKLELDFIFDYRRSNIFGIPLSSSETEIILKRNPKYKPVLKWLKNRNENDF